MKEFIKSIDGVLVLLAFVLVAMGMVRCERNATNSRAYLECIKSTSPATCAEAMCEPSVCDPLLTVGEPRGCN